MSGRRTVPYLSVANVAGRLVSSQQYLQWKAEGRIMFYCDEKWNYTSSNRKKYKYLPLEEGEAPGSDLVRFRRVKSRNNEPKVMYLGVIGQPSAGFNGLVFLKRVASERQVLRTSYNRDFTIDRQTQELILEGNWRLLFTGNDVPMRDLKETVIAFYQLDEDLDEQLAFTFESWDRVCRGRPKRRIVELDDDDVLEGKRRRTQEQEEVELTIEQVTMVRVRREGTWRTKDRSCDSAFMRETMPEIGAAIRASCEAQGIPMATPVYLQMDGAGGHGTIPAIEQYTRQLQEDHNVIIFRQAAQAPETNPLDLGVWNALQSRVDKLQRNRTVTNKAIALSVQQAWDDLPEDLITRVMNRLTQVHQLIVEDQGGNRLVQTRRRAEQWHVDAQQNL